MQNAEAADQGHAGNGYGLTSHRVLCRGPNLLNSVPGLSRNRLVVSVPYVLKHAIELGKRDLAG